MSEAIEWNQDGDHPEVEPYCKPTTPGAETPCVDCGEPMGQHGVMYSNGCHQVCPGMVIVKAANGWRLGEEYPTGNQPGPETDISKGLKRHLPMGYRELGSEREDGLLMAGAAFCIALGVVVMIVAMAVL